MYKIEKRFTFPMGHRLSKHQGACFNMHGHNYVVLVGMLSPTLNENDMVIDFGDLKAVLKTFMNLFDHACMINIEDKAHKTLLDLGFNIIPVDFEPTAERMSKYIFDHIKNCMLSLRTVSKNYDLDIEYVTIFENENSKATYCEDIKD